jgi:hypothetical protein
MSAPLKLVGSSTLLEFATSGDSQTVGTGLLNNGDVVTQNVGGLLMAVGPFVNLNLTTSMASTVHDLAAISGAEDTVPTLRGGSIIGVASCLSTHITAGTVSVRVTKNGSTVFTNVNAATSVRSWVTVQNKDVDTVVAGDRIGAVIITSADLAPANNDLTTYIYLEQ